jgi:hypothetical protein
MEMSFEGNTRDIKANGKVVATAIANTKLYELKYRVKECLVLQQITNQHVYTPCTGGYGIENHKLYAG